MMHYFKKIIRFAYPFWGYALLNVICNIFYALFSALAFVAFIPLMDVLFNQTVKVVEAPIYNGFSGLKDYLQQSLNYEVAQRVMSDPSGTLLYVIGLIIGLFLLKNIFNYLALFFITFLNSKDHGSSSPY